MYKIAKFAGIKFINNVLIFCSNVKGRLRGWKIYQSYLFDAKLMYPCIWEKEEILMRLNIKKLSRKVIAYSMAGAMIFTSVNLNSIQSNAAKKATVKLNKSSVTLKAGSKLTLKVTKKNVSKVKKITWKTSNKKIVTVSSKGVVKAVKAGNAKISVKVTYKAKGVKKYTNKSLVCKVKVTAKKNSVSPTKKPSTTKTPDATKTPDVTKAPDTTVTPGTEATATPGTEATKTPDVTATPGTDATKTPDATAVPGTDATKTPDASATAEPTKAPDTTKPDASATAEPTKAPDKPAEPEAPKELQSIKVIVKNGEAVVDADAAKVTMTNAKSEAVALTKGDDKSFTTAKLVAGTYTVKVDSLTVDGVVYKAVEKQVTIADDAKDEVQEVSIDIAFKATDKTYKATAKIVDGELVLDDSNDAKLKDIFGIGALNESGEEKTWLRVDVTKMSIEGMYSPYIIFDFGNGNRNFLIKNEDGKYVAGSYIGWGGSVSYSYADIIKDGGLGIVLTGEQSSVTVSVVDKNALPTWTAMPDKVTFTDNQEYTFDLGINMPVEGQKIDEDKVCVSVQCKAQDASYNGDYTTLATGKLENGVVKITVSKQTIEEHLNSCEYNEKKDISKIIFTVEVPIILSDGTTVNKDIAYYFPIEFAE